MAESVNPLDDILSSSVDESVISELVGSLESQLKSPTDKDKSHQLLDSTSQANHVQANTKLDDNSPALAGNSSHSQKMDLASSIQNVHKPTSSPNNILRTSLQQPQILGISSIMGSTSNVVVVSSTAGTVQQISTPVQANAGLSQAQGQGVSLLNPNGLQGPHSMDGQNAAVQPLTAISTVQSGTIVQSRVNNTIQNNHNVLTTNGPGTPSVTSSSGTAINAMYDLASIAAEQKPLAVPGATSDSLVSQIQAMKSEPVVISRTSPLTTNSPKPQFIIKQEDSNTLQGHQIIVKQDTQTQKIIKTELSSSPLVGGSQTVTVVRPVNPSSQGGTVQVISGPRIVTTAQARSLAPRLVQRIATTGSGTQTRLIAPSGMGSQQGIQFAPGGGMQIPPGAVFMKNQKGELVMVMPQQIRNQQVSTIRIPMSVASSGNVVSASPGLTVTRQQTPSSTQINTVKVVQAQPTAVASPMVQIRPQVKVEPKPVTVVSSQQASPNEGSLENVTKCRNFLSTLIKLAAKQPKETVIKVKKLIQDLVDGNLEPVKFTTELQDALSSSPQPYLVPFLKKSLPYLRQSLYNNEFTIEGVRPPPATSLQSQPILKPMTIAPSTSGTISAASQLQVMSQLQQLKRMGKKPSPELIQQLHAIHQAQKRGMQPKTEATPVQQQRFTPSQQQLFLQAQQIRKQQQQHALMTKTSQAMTLPATVNAVQARVGATAKPTVISTGHKEKRKFESLKDDDDINDVAAMGGVNLTEESRNILATANADLIGSQMRSCKDENFLHSAPLMQRVSFIAKKHGLSDVPQDVINLISHATQERLRHLVERLSTVTEHRLEIYKSDSRFEVSEDVRAQLKFLEELDKLEKKRHQEQEREMLLRAAKSRSKHEDPEQIKLKQKAKELQQAEMEEVRQRQANLTALNAIGPRKKRKLEAPDTGQSSSNVLGTAGSTPSRSVMRPRIKRVNLRDLLFIMEQEKETGKSNLLYKLFMK